MQIFIYTANLHHIRIGVLDGVTTNPSLMAKDGIAGDENVKSHSRAICTIVHGDVSEEVISTQYEEITREGEGLAGLNNKVVVMAPMLKDGVKAIRYFSEKGFTNNCALVFSAGQALLVAKVGATYISPFIGR